MPGGQAGKDDATWGNAEGLAGRYETSLSYLTASTRAQDAHCSQAFVAEHRAHACPQAWAEHQVGDVRLGLCAVGDPVLARHGAAPERAQLRQHVPDPVRGLALDAQLGQGLLEAHALLASLGVEDAESSHRPPATEDACRADPDPA